MFPFCNQKTIIPTLELYPQTSTSWWCIFFMFNLTWSYVNLIVVFFDRISFEFTSPKRCFPPPKKNGMQYLNSEVPHIISGKGRTSACAQRVTIQWSWMWPFRGTTVPCLHSEHGYLCLIYLSEGFLILIYFNFMMKCIFSQFKPTTYIFNYKKTIYIYIL